ncbi:MAG: NCS2 family permease [Clostridia bacterium]|nr:NCS2 family permease [Clostridia bacterium]MBQ3483018.1 NCS2 family permease [Clostridia bacterium]
MNKFSKLLGFDPLAKKTSVKTEIIAGIVTFLAMAYILTVNPNQILYASTSDPRWSSLFIATAFGAIIGTLLMAFLAKMPLAQASGMGLNSLLGTIIGGGVGAYSVYVFEFTVGQAFMMVLISGIIFLLLSLISIKGKTVRELVFDGMPVSIRSAISVGIGLFIAYIGFQNAQVIVANQYTQVALADFTNWDTCKTAVVALIGLFLIAILDKLNVKGSVILGILGATVVGIPFGVTNVKVITGSEGVSWKFWENLANFFTVGENSVFGSFTDVFSTGFPAGSLFTVIMLIITMCMIDMFDTMGTIVGCCGGNRILSDENNKPHNYGKIMMSDAIATCAGSMLGTSTVTTFVESGAGVSAGGRTGLTAFTTACMFLLAIFAMPMFAMIPSAATAAALIYVGVLMMKHNIKSVDFSTAINATSAFLTISVMVLSYSITKGIGIGLLSYTIMSALAYLVELIVASVKKTEKPTWNVSIVAIVVSALFAVYFFVPATLF